METYKTLQEEFSKWTGYKHAIAVNNGTSALHLALLAMGVKQGDEVIVPDFTFASCAFAVTYCNATPIFVDCDDSLNIDVSKIEEKITEKTKVIMGVHIYGRRCNMEAIKEIAQKHNLYVLEDLSEGHGIQPTGDIAIYSFQQTKIINSEEGGMIITNNDKWAEEMSLRKTLSNRGDYYHEILGFNYRMPESIAKLALTSFRNIDNNLLFRREKEKSLEKIYPKGGYRDVVWVYDIMFPTEEERNKALKVIGNSRPFFKPLSTLPMYNQKPGEKALYYSQRGLVIKI